MLGVLEGACRGLWFCWMWGVNIVGRPRNGGRKAAAPLLWASAARHHSVRAPSWGCAARAADIPKDPREPRDPNDPRPPNSGRPELVVYRPKAGWLTRGKALDNV